MDLSNLLLWSGGGILLMLTLQSLGAGRAERAAGLKVVLAITACTILCAWVVPPGYVLAALIAGLVILPGLAHARALAAFDAAHYRRCRWWSWATQLLLPRVDVRGAMATLRALCDYRSGASSDVEHLLHGLPEPQRPLLLAHIYSDEHRWRELAALLEDLPEPLQSSAPAWAGRMRLAYETCDYPGILPAYREVERRTGNRAQLRQLQRVRRDLLVMTGQVAAATAMEAALTGPSGRASQQLIQAQAQWCAGDGATAQRTLALLALPGAAPHRIHLAASRRLAHPPPAASQLPPELREAGAMLVRSVPRPLRRTWAVAGVIALNSIAFVITTLLTSQAVQPSADWDEVYSQVLLQLGGLVPSLCFDGHQWWRLVTADVLHAGVLHLGMNMFGLAMLGPLVERRLGWLRFLVLYLAAGVIGNLVFCVLATLQHLDPLVIGASGSIMGVVGALAAEALLEWRSGRAPPQRLYLIGVQVALQVTFDASHPEVAGSAHLGGLVAGFVIAALMLRQPRAAPPAAAG